MVLGLGTSAVNVIEHFHGYPYSMPLRRLREYVEIFNMLIKGDKLHYKGKIFQMERGFELNYERPRNHVPVFIAAITPLSIRQTGEIADGIYPIHWPIEKFSELRNQLKEGSSGASRGDVGMTIAPRTNVTITYKMATANGLEMVDTHFISLFEKIKSKTRTPNPSHHWSLGARGAGEREGWGGGTDPIKNDSYQQNQDAFE